MPQSSAGRLEAHERAKRRSRPSAGGRRSLGEDRRPLFFFLYPVRGNPPSPWLRSEGDFPISGAPMSPASEPGNFLHEVDSLIGDLVRRFDAIDPDELEAETSEGVLKLTFADGSKCVLNRQTAAQQVWLAEGASAWHFNYEPAARRWIDTKGRGELRAILGDVL